MKISTKEDYIIHKYIKGDLAEIEENIFRIKAKQKYFRDELLRQITVLKGIHDKQVNDLLDKLNLVNFEIEYSSSQSSQKSKLRIVIYGLIILIMSAMGYWVSQKSQKDITHYAAHMINESIADIPYKSGTRGWESDNMGAELTQQMKSLEVAISSKDYIQTATLFNSLESKVKLTVADRYFYANALVHQQKYDEAIALLTQVIERGDDIFKAEAIWLRALSFGMNNEKGKMESDLRFLQSTTNYQEQNINLLLEKLI